MDSQTEKIIQKYKEGYSIKKIAKELNCSVYKVDKTLKDNGINKRNRTSWLDARKECLDQIINDYKNGLSFEEIGHKIGVSRTAVTNVVKKYGLYIEDRGRVRPVNKHLKCDYFSVIDSEEKAYFLGLIITDGGTTRRNEFFFSLKTEDSYMVKTMAQKIGIDSVYDEERRFVTKVNNKQLVKDLQKYGVIPNKTYLLKNIPIENIPIKYRNHFWRGVFDGDGSIRYSENGKYQLSICEYNYVLVEQIRDEMDTIIQKETHNKIRMANCWTIDWHKKSDIKKILDYLYTDATLYLKRKHERYLSFLEYYKKTT